MSKLYLYLLEIMEKQEEVAKKLERIGRRDLAAYCRSIFEPMRQTLNMRGFVGVGAPRGCMPGKRLTAEEVTAGILKSVEAETGLNIAVKALQHVTSGEELVLWIRTLKAMCTKDGGLDKEAYHNALSAVRDSMQFTCDVLKEADVDEAAKPGFEVLIRQYEENITVIEKEIFANRGGN